MAIDLDALITKARQSLENVTPTDIPVVIDDEIVTFRLRPLSGPDWRDLTAKFPARKDTPIDHTRGYNLTGVARAYPRVAVLDGDTETDAAKKWADITSVLAGEDMRLVEYTVWGINEFDPAKRAEGKVLKGESSK